MKTFKPGLYSSLLISVAMLSVMAGITRIAWRGNPGAIDTKEVAAPAKSDFSAQSESKELIATLPTSPNVDVPWNTPGVWRVVKTKESSAICLYSDEQIKINKARGDDGSDSLAGAFCIVKRQSGWVYLIEAPMPGTNYSFDGHGLIDVEFTMKDGSMYFAHYWTSPDGRSAEVHQIGDMAEFNPFGRMATAAKHIKITSRTLDGVRAQEFQNGMVR